MAVYKVFKIIDVFTFAGMATKLCTELNTENPVNFGA